jgi:hypothetical protein
MQKNQSTSTQSQKISTLKNGDCDDLKEISPSLLKVLPTEILQGEIKNEKNLHEKTISLITKNQVSGELLEHIFPNEISFMLGLAKKSKAEDLLLKILTSQNYPLLIVLLRNGLDPYYSNSLLMRYALYHCNFHLFKLLSENGYNIKKTETWLLGYSIEFSLPFARKLLMSGADINKTLQYAERYISRPHVLPRLVSFGINVEKLNVTILKTLLAKCDLSILRIIFNFFETIPLQKMMDICNENVNCDAIIYNFIAGRKLTPISKVLIIKIFDTIKLYKSHDEYLKGRTIQIKKFYLVTIIKAIVDKLDEKKSINIPIEKLLEAKQINLFDINLKLINQPLSISVYCVAKVFYTDSLELFKGLEKIFHKLDWDLTAFFKFAVEAGSRQIINYLVTHYKRINLLSYSLHNAIRYRHVDLIEFFLFQAINLRKNDAHCDREVLINETLSKCGWITSTSLVRFLLECGASYTYKECRFLKAICSYENIYILDYLITHQSLNLKTDGEMMLEYACRLKCYVMAEFLLLRGVKGVIAVCELYNLHCFEGAEFLINHGVDKNDALLTACSFGYFIACKHLIREGANAHTNDDNTLALACYDDNLSIVKLLVDEGAIINDQIIFAACTSPNDSTDIIRFLIKKTSENILLSSKLVSVSEKVGNFKIHQFLKKINFQRFMQ